ncbi:MAG TPA: phenylalanine--tRNA ligase subunit beta [Acidimicrobiia bacterium]|nr:phenylalanine--tRNA ligase subunit beta [Acidimicrobiia bacterium]
MKVSLNWLLEFVDLPTRETEELRRTLAMLGHEVDGVERIEANWSKVVVAEVEFVAAHPDADRVRLCTVKAGGEAIEVVCGAWNFDAGARVAFAEPGAVLPGGFEIGVRSIRGVESHGMICSERELGLGEDAEGILVLEGDAPIGEPLENFLSLPDVIFDLSITTNRPDAMSILGIARDMAAWYQVPYEPPTPQPATVPGEPGLTVTIEDPVGNPRFVARRVDDVTVVPSPLWMRTRLRNSGIRPISNLVDITNYVMLELGQPLHVFDADKVVDQQLTVRRAKPGETLVTLDGAERRLTPEDLVIYDSEGPTSLSGTMGGQRSEVSDTTTSIIIEAASWDAPTILSMSRRHGLRSEASARFERGVDPLLPPLASLRAAELVQALAGGHLRQEWIDEVAMPFEPTTVELAVGDVTRLLGEGFDPGRITDLLERLGFEVSGSDPLVVEVPSYRPDVGRTADLVEEVARLADYDTFGERLRLGRGGGLTSEQTLSRRLRDLLVGVGYSQAVSLPFVTPAEIGAFTPPPGHELHEVVRVKNPLSDEESILRPSLLPALLRALRHNRNRGRADVALFELGRVFHNSPWSRDWRVPTQPNRLGIAAIGVVAPADLSGQGHTADITAITGLIRHLADGLGLGLTLEQATAPGYHPTRTARVMSGSEVVGFAGELHPLTAQAFELDGRVGVAELDLDLLLGSRRTPEYRPVSPYPPADFDLSFEVDSDLAASDLVATIVAAGRELTESVRVFDEYIGGNLDQGHKALALRVRLRATDRTLTAEDIAEGRRAMIEAAAARGASLRGSS